LNEPRHEELKSQALEFYRRDGNFERVYPLFDGMDMKRPSIRRAVYEYRDRLARQADPAYLPPAAMPLIENALAELDDVDEEAVWQQAVAEHRKARERLRRQRAGRLVWDYGAVCLVFMADTHLGGTGVDVEAIDRDIDMVLETPGAYIVGVGDLLDNFIIGKLMAIQMDTPFTIDAQWSLVRRMLRRMAPRLVASVGGNHDNWTRLLSGVDYFREVHEQIVGRHILLGKNELRVTVQVGEAEFPLKIRHKWRGFSMYNPTHAAERDAKFNSGYPWRVGVAAHTHTGGYVREFNRGGQTALAVQCGTYKRIDDYADTNDFPEPNDAAAVAVILDDQGDMWGTSNLRAALKYMKAVHGGAG